MQQSQIKPVSITVGPEDADIIGADNRALQAAVDYVANIGGGVVNIAPGNYDMRNSLFLRSGVDILADPGSVTLRAAKARTTRLSEDAGYGVSRAVVEDTTGLEPGTGVLFNDDQHNGGWYENVRTIVAIDGDTILLDQELGLDFIAERNATIHTVFPITAGMRVQGVRIEGIVARGNPDNPAIGGCRGGAIYFWKSESCTIADCRASDFSGDGISYQSCPNTTVVDCGSCNNSGLGVHPGTGSERTDVSGCNIHENGSIGLFLCWRVKHSRFSNNLIHHNGGDGISIGHKDTDNVFLDNTVEDNGRHGVHFRPETEPNSGHRNKLHSNTIRNNGRSTPADGIHIEGITHDIEIVGNTIASDAEGEAAGQQNAIVIGEHASRVIIADNEIAPHPGEDIIDRSTE